MMLTPTTQQEVISIINQLPLKSSSGHDGMSNDSLTYPFTLIFKQSLHRGVFTRRMKLAEVIPLYKNKAMDHLVNYQPISLLMTMSKVLEKLVYKRVISLKISMKFYIRANMAFKISAHMSRQSRNYWQKYYKQGKMDRKQQVSLWTFQKLLIHLTINPF